MLLHSIKTNLLGTGLVLGLLAAVAAEVSAKEAPVAKLVQIEGTVEYSRNGKNWLPVRRTKYLFSGYQVRTGEDGTGKIVNQGTGKSRELGTSTLVEIAADAISVIDGSLSEPRDEEVSLYNSLINKFEIGRAHV